MQRVGGEEKKWNTATRDEGQKDRRVEESARDHPVGMTGATERGEKRRER